MADKPEKRHLLATLQHASEPLMLAELISASGTHIPDRTARRWLSLWIDEGIVLKCNVPLYLRVLSRILLVFYLPPGCLQTAKLML
jgi:hypothetical protein